MQSGDTKYHKAHAFDFSNGVPGFDENKPGIGNSRLLGQKGAAEDSSRLYPANAQDGESVPAWVAFDRQVLRFDAYFREAVHEKRDENYRIRKCVSFFWGGAFPLFSTSIISILLAVQQLPRFHCDPLLFATFLFSYLIIILSCK